MRLRTFLTHLPIIPQQPAVTASHPLLGRSQRYIWQAPQDTSIKMRPGLASTNQWGQVPYWGFPLFALGKLSLDVHIRSYHDKDVVKEKTMAKDTHIYGEVDNKTDMKNVFSAIRDDVEKADSRAELTELYRRAGYLITLTNASSWEKKFGDDIEDIRETAEDEFSKTARKINDRAEKIGTDADYDEKWGE
jgi:hypothetical protein